MKILHILNDGASGLSEQIIEIQSRDHEVRVVDLQKKEISYETIVDDIFLSDRVISW